ncbi:hypothetical protein M0805_006331 [Coniferiporia weirii]|nr:hypothetical protein M0805_006331 [Coniferiporia weirii]
MYNAKGEYNLPNVYGYYASLNSNEVSQPYSPTSNGAYPPVHPYSTPPPVHSPVVAPHFLAHLPLVSESGMITVIGYTPSEGEANIPITVDIELRSGEKGEETFGYNMSLVSMKLRLVLGRTALKTTVKRILPMRTFGSEEKLEQGDVMRLRLYAFAPLHSEVRFPGQFCVPITIQAMDSATEVIESFTFGSFTYWTPNTVKPANTVDSYKLPDVSTAPLLKRKRGDDDARENSETARSESSPPSSPKKALTAPRVFKLVRTTNAPAEALDDGIETHTAVLEWVVGGGALHPNSLDKRWSALELEMGRRLIRFKREQANNKLLVSCEVISQEAYDEDDIVISCVYRQETSNCWFTSVDVIYLLERLVGSPFSVEEKNRIRRNLEGLKPTTVSKHKPGYETFFQRIMDFPPPRPRNIEKDVKVFPWSVLCQALDKIISKYSVISSEASEASSSQKSISPPSSGQADLSAKSSDSSSEALGSQSTSDGPVYPPIVSATPQKLPHPFSEHLPQQAHPYVDSPPVLHADSISIIPEPEEQATPAPPMDQLYDFPNPQDLAFSDHWRRRGSLASLASTHADEYEYYTDPVAHGADMTPMPLHEHAFSNPFASNINLANPAGVDISSLSLNGHVGQGGLQSGQGSPDGMDTTELADGSFAAHSRDSNLAGELLHPDMNGTNSLPHNGLVSTYGPGALGQDTPNDLLYAQFSTNSPFSPMTPSNGASKEHLLIFSLFKTLTDQTVTVELKNDLSITGVLKSVDQFLNIRLDNIKVLDEARHPHMMAVKNCFIRGSVVRYVQLPAQHVDTQLLEDATRRGSYLAYLP